jgi:glucose-6-phosphate isomerase
LGKVLAQRIIPELESETEPALSHDSSTNTLIRALSEIKGLINHFAIKERELVMGIRIGINGFGRIGRQVYKAIRERTNSFARTWAGPKGSLTLNTV